MSTGFFSDLTGNSQRSDFDAGLTAATGAVQQGTAAASGFFDKATGAIAPFAAPTGYDAYVASLGLGPGGPAGAEQSYQDYISNPGLRDAATLGVKYADQKYAGEGLANSGGAIAGLGNVSLGFYDNYLNKLAGLGQQEQNAAGQEGQYYTQQGDLYANEGNELAGLDTNHATQVAGTRGTLGQNIIGAAGAAAGAYGTGLTLNKLAGYLNPATTQAGGSGGGASSGQAFS